MTDVGRRMTDVGSRRGRYVVRRLSSVARYPSRSAVRRPSSAQYARAELDDGDHVEQKHKRSQCKRDRDRPHAAAALLLFREYDARLSAVIVHASILLLTAGPGRVRPASH